MALVLYTALADGLSINSAIASWPWPRNAHAPLDPGKPSTQALLSAGKIGLAPDGAVDNVTPANIERGTPGLKTCVSN